MRRVIRSGACIFSLLAVCYSILCLVHDAVGASEPLPASAVLTRFAEIPVEITSGEFKQFDRPDLYVKSRKFGIEVSRNYSNQREEKGLFGYGWGWKHMDRLDIKQDFVIEIVSANSVQFALENHFHADRWAANVRNANDWNNEQAAQGLPDGVDEKYTAWSFGLEQGADALTADQWDFEVIPDTEIVRVEATVVGVTGAHESDPDKGLKMKIHAGGSNWSGWGRPWRDFETVDITSDRGSWTWDDVNNLKVYAERHSAAPNGDNTEVHVDAFNVLVEYKPANGENLFSLPFGASFGMTRSNSQYVITYKDQSRVVFTSEGKLERKEDPHGNALLFDYDVYGRLDKMKDQCGQYVSFIYEDSSTNANVVEVQDHLGRSCYYAYTNDNLVSFTDLEGNTTRYEYLAGQTATSLNHNLSKIIDPIGSTVLIEYYEGTNAQDRVCKFTDASSNKVLYAYGDRIAYSCMEGMGTFQAAVYNGNRDISGIMIRDGEFEVDENDTPGLMSEGFSSSATNTSGWLNISNLHGEEDGNVATNDLAPDGLLELGGWTVPEPGVSNVISCVKLAILATVESSASITMSSRIGAGTPSTNQALLSQAATLTWNELTLEQTNETGIWTWNDLANLTAIISNNSGSLVPVAIDATRLVVSYESIDIGERPEDKLYYYDLEHNIIASKINGHKTYFTYDDKSNLISKRNDHGEEWSYQYDARCNKLTHVVDPLGNVTRYVYNAFGDLAREVDALGNITTYEYDDFGNVVKTTDPLGHTIESTYDSDGIHVVSRKDRNDNTKTYEYDNVGNPTKETAPDSSYLEIAYNNYNQKTTETDPASVVTKYHYDASARMTNMVVAFGSADETSTRYYFDASDRPIETVDADGRSRYNYFDSYGNRTAKVDRVGQMTVYRYDDYARVMEEVDAMQYTNCVSYDGIGNVLTNVDKRGNATVFTYDHNGQVLTTTDAAGNAISNEYDLNGNKIRETITTLICEGCSGDTVQTLVTEYVYDALDRLVSRTVGVGRSDARTTTLEYDANGRVTKETDALGHYYTTAYDGNGNITNMSFFSVSGDLLSRTAYDYNTRNLRVTETSYTDETTPHSKTMAYDDVGRLISETDALGNTISMGYDAHGRVSATTNAVGDVRSFSYDESGNKIQEVNEKGTITSFGWDAAARLTNQVVGVGLPDARTVLFEYDASGGLIRQTDPLNYTTEFTYDENGNRIAQKDQNDNVTTAHFDVLNRATNTIDALENTVQVFYDGRGNVRKTMDSLGNITLSEYDVYGQLVQVTDAESNVVTFAYDAKGQKVLETDARGFQASFEYDGLGRVTNKVIGVGLASARTYTYTYDMLGRLLTETDPLTNTVQYVYDANGNQAKVIDKRGNASTNVYDELNRVVVQVDALDKASYLEYDELGQVTRVTDRRNGVTIYTNDAFGQRISSTDPEGNTTTFSYDILGRLTNSVDALGYAESQSYDGVGNVLTRIDRRNATNEFSYDVLNRLVSTTNALGHTTTRIYDANGNLLQATDKRGFTTTYTYDGNNRVLTVTDPATNTVTYSYDGNGNRTSSTDPLGLVTRTQYTAFNEPERVVVGYGRADARIVTRTYDSAGRMKAETDPLGYAVAYECDENGNQTKITDKRGYVVTNAFDELNRLVSTTDPFSNTAHRVYDAMGNLLQEIDRRGNDATNAFDLLGRVVASVDFEGNTTTYEYDAVGNEIRMTDPRGTITRMYHDGGGLVTGRIIGEGQADARTQTNTYDAIGRRTRAVDPLGDYVQTLYDPNGNVTNVEFYNSSDVFLRETSSSYDSRNLLTASTDARGYSTTYAYDALGRRVSATDPLTNTVQTVYDAFGNVVEIIDQLGESTRTVYDKRNQPVKVIDALGHQNSFEYDENGNRTVVRDDSGYTTITYYDALNRPEKINRSTVDVAPSTLKRADVNGDGRVDDDDLAALE